MDEWCNPRHSMHPILPSPTKAVSGKSHSGRTLEQSQNCGERELHFHSALELNLRVNLQQRLRKGSQNKERANWALCEVTSEHSPVSRLSIFLSHESEIGLVSLAAERILVDILSLRISQSREVICLLCKILCNKYIISAVCKYTQICRHTHRDTYALFIYLYSYIYVDISSSEGGGNVKDAPGETVHSAPRVERFG